MKDNQKRIITTQKIDDYCLWLDRCERSRETIQKYEYYLTRFKEFMDCRPVDKEMVILWKSVLRENLAPVTGRAERLFQILRLAGLQGQIPENQQKYFLSRKPGAHKKRISPPGENGCGPGKRTAFPAA